MSEKYAVVTGADRGVGLALTENLLERGYYVFAGRYDSSWTGMEVLQEKYGDRLQTVQMDISSDESVRTACAQIMAACPQLDLLINNAGVLGDIETRLTGDINFNEIVSVYNTNAVGPLRVIHGLVEHLLKSDQKLIVTISSEAGSVWDCKRENWFAYCMSKSALNMSGALVYNAIREQGGRVLLFHPGHVRTYMRGGQLDASGKISAEESAAGILKQSLDIRQPDMEQVIYMDYTGERLPF